MPFFLLIPLWLGLLACSAVLAVFRRTRVFAIYTAVSSTSAVLCSILISTAAIAALAKIGSYSRQGSSWQGLLLLIGYGGSILAGGAVGAVAGVILVLRLREKKRNFQPLDEAEIYSVRQPFGRKRL